MITTDQDKAAPGTFDNDYYRSMCKFKKKVNKSCVHYTPMNPHNLNVLISCLYAPYTYVLL